MRTADILQMAFDAEPEMMKEAAVSLALLQRIQPAFVPDVVEDFQKIAKRVSEKTKEAGAKDFAKGVGFYAAGTVAAGLGLAIATDLYNAARKGLTQGRNFRRMMEADPELHGRDRQRLQQAFRVVQRNAPDVASDPLAAAALTAKYMDAPEHGHDKNLREMLELQRAKQEARYTPFSSIPKGPIPMTEAEQPSYEMRQTAGKSGTEKSYSMTSPTKPPGFPF